MGSQPYQVNLSTSTVYVLLDVIMETGTSNYCVLVDVFLLGTSNMLNNTLRFRNDLIILLYLLLFFLIDLLHCSF